MSTIYQLGIQGIRSYPSDQISLIEFNKPLTLITGNNGSGKTVMTAGEYPPGSNGGKSFIMDPKMANNGQGQPETIARIRLAFQSINQKTLMQDRQFSFTIKEKKQEFKTLQQILVVKDKNGQKESINHTCTELERIVPDLLGITRPVLENVIFCHQEQSLWPFSDNATLKQIFDQLFDTTKFTKLIETLNDQEKALNQEIRELETQIKYEQTMYSNQVERKNKLVESGESLKIDCNEIPVIQKEISQLQLELRKFQQLEKKLSDKQGEQRFLDLTLNQMKEELEIIEMSLDGEKFDYSLQDLMESKNQEEGRFEVKNKMLQAKIKEEKEITSKLDENQRQLEKLLDSDKVFNQLSSEIYTLKEKVCSKSAGGEFDKQQADDMFLLQLQGFLEKLKNQMDSQTQANEMELQKLEECLKFTTNEVNSWKIKEGVLQQNESELQSQIMGIDGRLRDSKKTGEYSIRLEKEIENIDNQTQQIGRQITEFEENQIKCQELVLQMKKVQKDQSTANEKRKYYQLREIQQKNDKQKESLEAELLKLEKSTINDKIKKNLISEQIAIEKELKQTIIQREELLQELTQQEVQKSSKKNEKNNCEEILDNLNQKFQRNFTKQSQSAGEKIPRDFQQEYKTLKKHIIEREMALYGILALRESYIPRVVKISIQETKCLYCCQKLEKTELETFEQKGQSEMDYIGKDFESLKKEIEQNQNEKRQLKKNQQLIRDINENNKQISTIIEEMKKIEDEIEQIQVLKQLNATEENSLKQRLLQINSYMKSSEDLKLLKDDRESLRRLQQIAEIQQKYPELQNNPPPSGGHGLEARQNIQQLIRSIALEENQLVGFDINITNLSDKLKETNDALQSQREILFKTQHTTADLQHIQKERLDLSSKLENTQAELYEVKKQLSIATNKLINDQMQMDQSRNKSNQDTNQDQVNFSILEQIFVQLKEKLLKMQDHKKSQAGQRDNAIDTLRQKYIDQQRSLEIQQMQVIENRFELAQQVERHKQNIAILERNILFNQKSKEVNVQTKTYLQCIREIKQIKQSDLERDQLLKKLEQKRFQYTQISTSAQERYNILVETQVRGIKILPY